MVGFVYPTRPHARRHGPCGYKNYESFRDWLRDEFSFRCVYCLHREQWYGRGAAFHIDHFTPAALNTDGECEYANLVYACAACNEAKNAIIVPDPCKVALHDCLRIMPDGYITPLNNEGKKLEQVLRLNSAQNLQYRARLMRTLETLREHNFALYLDYMRFPDDLPDLREKHVPSNSKPEGLENCYFALRARGNLPETY